MQGESRGKSGLHRAACRLTAGEVRSKRTLRISATENIPLVSGNGASKGEKVR